ncbi:hypothetical protein LQ327_08920 [Actinomycetospora endophytica]|uniref:DUF2550 family protein n=1 Tax=Actinomycetospora endophytica TaxID=2291215 RepID=A0ABS8P5G9_9PSEU|nr:hypothetical protein [Actinomycetospora endophytica]MCD2193503.1 hypothetical protein [Actinomycetospora endophytica]
MIPVLITLWACTVVFAVAAIAVTPWLRRERVMRSMVRRRYIAFRRDGGAPFDGLLVEWDERTLVFADVHTRGSGMPQDAAPGLLYLDRERIDYLQYVVAEQGGPPVAVPDSLADINAVGQASPFISAA